MIDASEDSINLTNHKVLYLSEQFYVSDTSPELENSFTLAERLTQMTYLSADGSSVNGSSGSRASAPSSGGTIGEFQYGRQMQLVVTSTETRGTDFTNESATGVIGITEPFTVGVDTTPSVELYEWASGF